MTGPYQNLPAHGIAFDTWAGIVSPQVNEDGFAYLPEHASMGIHAGPLFGALGILAAVLRARTTGEGSFLEVAQSDAAAAMDWYRSETWKAYERPESEVTGNKADDYERREPGTAGMIEGVRYQVYEAKDGRYVLFMASEQAFWKNFCAGGRPHGHVRALAGLEVRRPRPQQPRDAGRAPRHLPHPDRRGVDRLRGDRQRPGQPGQLARRPSPRTPSSTTGSTGSPGSGSAPSSSPPRSSSSARSCPSRPTPRPSASTPTRCSAIVLGWDDDRIAESRARGGLGGTDKATGLVTQRPRMPAS